MYKEKLRIRCYNQSTDNSQVFVELKKKYKSIVYKRRTSLPYKEAIDWMCGGNCNKHTQITDEINYFISFYKTLKPTIFLSYNRTAYVSCNNPELRITFDSNILCRQNDLSLCNEISGTPILPSNIFVMEIKCSGGIPLWLTKALTQEQIYKTSFSKYGTAYKNLIFSEASQNDRQHF